MAVKEAEEMIEEVVEPEAALDVVESLDVDEALGMLKELEVLESVERPSRTRGISGRSIFMHAFTLPASQQVLTGLPVTMLAAMTATCVCLKEV